jgi:peptidoglycan/xylan/chitin deacetylase (PgdA/CDA1 family)
MKAEHIGAIVYRDLIWNFHGKENELFLTFDDGPEPDITNWVLSVLKEYDAKATFFCVGNKVEKFPETYNKIINEGHSVGNHTYSHVKGWTTASKEYISNIEKASLFIDSNLFRPPYGRIRPHQIKALKKDYKIIMWDVLSKDYDSEVSNEECLKNVLDYAESGSIVVFHDKLKAQEKLKFVLPKVLKHFSEKGFTFNVITSS